MVVATREEILKRHSAGESLAGLDLSQADLHGCALRELRAAGLAFRRANLKGCDLSGSSLAGADLAGADLRGSFLNDCNLEDANLAGADLRFCKLTGAKIEGVNFQGALYDRMTRFDPGVVHPFEVMTKKDEGRGIFLKKEEP